MNKKLLGLMLFLGLMAFGSKARAADLFVDGSATSTASSTYATIQAAVDASANGDVIHVVSGTYNEHVNVNKSVSLQGDNRTSIVDGGGTDAAFQVTANDV